MDTTSNNSAGALDPIDIREVTPAKTPDDLAAFVLPDEPLVTIQPGTSWTVLNLRELWNYRELLFFLTWRDVKVRYKQTALGVAWVVMQPLLSTLIFTVFLGMLARVPSDGTLPYPLFVFAGMIPWLFFSSAVSGSSNSLVSNANLITKVYFPRLIIPFAATAGRLLDFVISFAVLAALMLFYGVAPTWSILWLPAFILMLVLLALGMGMWASAVNVKYRDVGAALPVLIQMWMFASPVIYPSRLVPERWRWAYALNPLVGILEGFRSALFGRPLDGRSLLISAGIILALFVYGAYTFRRMERGFADVV
jgi:lipopolysaccharide transport system permease protein